MSDVSNDIYTICDSVSDAIIFINSEFKILHANDMFNDYFGYRGVSIVGNEIFCLMTFKTARFHSNLDIENKYKDFSMSKRHLPIVHRDGNTTVECVSLCRIKTGWLFIIHFPTSTVKSGQKFYEKPEEDGFSEITLSTIHD